MKCVVLLGEIVFTCIGLEKKNTINSASLYKILGIVLDDSPANPVINQLPCKAYEPFVISL